MLQQGPVWLDILSRTLRRLPARLDETAAGGEQANRPDFKSICDEVEGELARAGVRRDAAEWQATKLIMKSIYQKTRSAEKNGYDFFQYALTPHLADTSLNRYLQSPRIQQAVGLWCSTLGWRRASIVNWTSVEAAIAGVTSSRYPFVASEFAVRLEGLGKQPPAEVRGVDLAARRVISPRPRFGE